MSILRTLSCGALAAGLLALAACKSAPDTSDGPPKHAASGTPTPDIRGEEVEYGVGGTRLKGYIAWDANVEGPRPGVLVVHEWWGHDDYARERARMLAGMGYTALALDMYGDGKKAAHPGDAKKFMMEVVSNMDVGVERFMAAKKILEAHATTDDAKTAAIGYCFGGAVVLHMARSGMALVGVASFHGGLQTKVPAAPGAIKAKILVAHGAADPMVPQEHVDAFQKEMADAGAELKFVAYPGAKHAFTNPAATARGAQFGIPLAYDEEADKKSWQELDTFLAGLFPR